MNPAADHNAVIRNASAWGNLEIVRQLLQHSKVNPADSNNEALELAVRRGHSGVVKELLSDKRVSGSLKAGQLRQYLNSTRHKLTVLLCLQNHRLSSPEDEELNSLEDLCKFMEEVAAAQQSSNASLPSNEKELSDRWRRRAWQTLESFS